MKMGILVCSKHIFVLWSLLKFLLYKPFFLLNWMLRLAMCLVTARPSSASLFTGYTFLLFLKTPAGYYVNRI